MVQKEEAVLRSELLGSAAGKLEFWPEQPWKSCVILGWELVLSSLKAGLSCFTEKKNLCQEECGARCCPGRTACCRGVTV